MSVLKAIVNHKCSNYDYSEDCLTSTIFGAFRYLDINKGILTFLKDARLYSHSSENIEQNLKIKGIDINKYDELKCYFWPRTKEYDEPDLICVFKDNSQNQEDLVLLVECKFKSSKSSSGDRDQLMRYYDDLHNKIDCFNNRGVSELKTSLRYLIYLTQFEAGKEIEESIEEIKKRAKSSHDLVEIFSLKWDELFYVFERYRDSDISKAESTIIDDLVEYMEVIGLSPFCGFKELDLDITNEDKIFFRGN